MLVLIDLYNKCKTVWNSDSKEKAPCSKGVFPKFQDFLFLF